MVMVPGSSVGERLPSKFVLVPVRNLPLKALVVDRLPGGSGDHERAVLFPSNLHARIVAHVAHADVSWACEPGLLLSRSSLRTLSWNSAGPTPSRANAIMRSAIIRFSFCA